jgi:hypothetical protein
MPRVIHVAMPKKRMAINNRITFTANDPIRLPAISKNKALSVQKTATNSAEISPVYTMYGVKLRGAKIVHIFEIFIGLLFLGLNFTFAVKNIAHQSVVTQCPSA